MMTLIRLDTMKLKVLTPIPLNFFIVSYSGQKERYAKYLCFFSFLLFFICIFCSDDKAGKGDDATNLIAPMICRAFLLDISLFMILMTLGLLGILTWYYFY
ncbi:MAG: hypothetical protein A2W90_17805 [Bacteroidetes bacterium GWF2_42_66]|nr:MAG: hypothetical protein A2W92_13075 [Bacteroidetes bacterium GWA2_42_15]OFX98109.1 MAG: hypothetical protein A2W89_09295 [Bacteroidetes bacterium GWE2_42_39]OFY42493.1 MAG: hypothetical protein A2W90_17805 [Bacteroidetes bacterium GWF2_42_66]HAZ03792.1 hypothetical protein [Marinilabiliales bacterium]HBL74208.1 hypothetical protein [Prolixibacteraceae bacterium]